MSSLDESDNEHSLYRLPVIDLNINQDLSRAILIHKFGLGFLFSYVVCALRSWDKIEFICMLDQCCAMILRDAMLFEDMISRYSRV